MCNFIWITAIWDTGCTHFSLKRATIGVVVRGVLDVSIIAHVTTWEYVLTILHWLIHKSVLRRFIVNMSRIHTGGFLIKSKGHITTITKHWRYRNVVTEIHRVTHIHIILEILLALLMIIILLEILIDLWFFRRLLDFANLFRICYGICMVSFYNFRFSSFLAITLADLVIMSHIHWLLK